MTTVKHKTLPLIREEGLAYTYSAGIKTKNNWFSVEGCSSNGPFDISIIAPKGVIIGEHLGRIEMTMTDIINQSPKLLKEINKAREGLKHETLLDYDDVFGK